MTAVPGALQFLSSSLAQSIRPFQPDPFPIWLLKNIVLVDGPRKGELWTPDDAPYLPPIAECLSIEHPCNVVSVRKAQQTGVSILALAWSLYLAQILGDNILYGLPTKDMLQDIESSKLQPLIDAWQKEIGKTIIEPATSTAGKGSTKYEKKFPGGSLFMANVNSKTDLSGKTIRFGVEDEVSKWATLSTGEDPQTLFFGRFTAFRRKRNFKIFRLSTPEVDTGDELGDAPGHCRIDRSFLHSDQRFWFIKCPECQFEQVQFFENLKINRKRVHKSVYVCESCGHEISETERVIAVRGGEFKATQFGPDREPGFHVDAFMSLMMSYGDIANDHIESESKGEIGAKDFSNLVLALPYAMKGNAPDHVRLMERSEDYNSGVIPADGLIYTAGVDVQHNGLWVQTVAFAPDRQTWVIIVTFLPGATDDINRGAWKLLDDFEAVPVSDVYGNDRYIDATAVDSGDGNRVNQVYEWCRRRPDVRFAIKGVGGRGVPAIGVPSKKSVYRSGRKQRIGSAMVWPVGTWTLKSEFYGNLAKQGIAAGEPCDPPGYCHFGKFLAESFYKQITAEYFHQEVKNGRRVEDWKVLRPDNHQLDCRVYAMAMAEHLGLTRFKEDDWAKLRARIAPGHDLDLFQSEPARVDATRDMPDAETTVSEKGRAAKRKSLEDLYRKLNG